MNFLKSLFAILLFVGLTITSCKKDEIVRTDTDTPTIKPTNTQVNGLLERSGANSSGLELGCVNIPYPFGMLLTDSSQVTINTESDLETALNDSTNFVVDFVYPLNVTDANGNPVIVNSIDDLGALFADCVPTTGWNDTFPDWFFPAWDISLDNSCFELVYPLTLLDDSGTPTVAANQDSLIALLSSGEIYSFSFPLNLKDADGNTVVAADQSQLFDLLASCGGGDVPGGCGDMGSYGCFSIGYPATLTFANGSTVVVNDIDEFAAAVMGGEWTGFGFPLTLVNVDGTQLVVNNEQEFGDAILSCDGNGTPSGSGDLLCYNLTFPVTLIDQNGTSTTIANQSAWQNFIPSSTANEFQFVFPITLTKVATGDVTIVSDPGELSAALQDCW